MMKRILKIVLGLLVGVLLLLLAAVGVLNTDAIQQKLLAHARAMLEERLGTKVEIAQAHVGLLDGRAHLTGLKVYDQRQRVLLQLEDLGVRVALWPLLRREVVVQEAGVTGLKADLRKEAADSVANYQFLIDAFKRKPKPKVPKEETQKKEKLVLRFDMQEMLLRDIHLHLLTDHEKPRKNTNKPNRGFFDVGHLDLTADLDIAVQHITQDSIHAVLKKGQARDSITGIDLRDLRLTAALNKQKAHLTEVVIQQGQTVLNIDTADVWLPSKKEQRGLFYETSTIHGKTLLKDIARPFAPALSRFELPLELSVRLSGTDSTMQFKDVAVNTPDQRLKIAAVGGITDLRGKERLAIRFKVDKMTAKNDVIPEIINQFPLKKKFMMKQLRALGTIGYKGTFAILWKREQFEGVLNTATGHVHFDFALDERTKYVIGTASTNAIKLGKLFNVKGLGDAACDARFKIDFSKERTAAIRRKVGGKLPIGTVSANVREATFKKAKVHNVRADIQSDGAVAEGEVYNIGKLADVSCAFTFNNTDSLHKMKVKPRLKFHKKYIFF